MARDEDASTRHYARRKAEELKPRGAPPTGCGSCRGTGSFTATVAHMVEGHRIATDYACRCTCAKGADIFRGLPTLDQLHKMFTGEVLIEPTPRERAGLIPMTIDECIAESARMQAMLIRAPEWKLGDRMPT